MRAEGSTAVPHRQRWLAAATNRAILGRSIVTCLVVGALLTVINHGDQLLRGEFNATIAWQIGLTFLVPFVVATTPGAVALRSRDTEQALSADGVAVQACPGRPDLAE